MLRLPKTTLKLSHKTKPKSRYLSKRKYSAKKQEIVDFAKEHLFPAVTQISPLVFEKSLGSYVWDIDGDKYLDFTTGIGVANTGHAHPKVVKAIQDQCAKGIHSQVNVGIHQPMIELTKKLLAVLPKSLGRIFYANSGSEAIENAIKLARYATKKQNVIAVKGSFHGRTNATMALTSSKTVYRTGFGPFMPGVHFASYPYCARCSCAKVDEECCYKYEEEWKDMFATECDPSDVAAIIIEPILGEGGYTVPPKSYLQMIRKYCDQHNIMLIADEVQSGFGRTGKFWGFENFDVVPDIVIMAKGIASGLPLSAVAARSDLPVGQTGGSMGGTYVGNVVSCAAAVATMEIMTESSFLPNVLARGEQLKSGLQKFQANPKYNILDVRGRGLMIGLEFNDKKLAKGTASKVQQACVRNKMLLFTTGSHETIRFIPPLTVSEAEVTEALAIFQKSLDEVFN